ncbi:hypothetical protein [Nostoc sp.]|uniref:hypothetical protein n=1 Tax=Nostoc sp. TaxID=1180 RepID=UPI002FF6462E
MSVPNLIAIATELLEKFGQASGNLFVLLIVTRTHNNMGGYHFEGFYDGILTID